MPLDTFLILFGVTWFIAMAYGLSAFRLLLRLRALNAMGQARDAPNPLGNPLEVFGYIVWLLKGRYGEINDAVVKRWSAIARVLFVVAAPLLLAVFAIVLTQGDSLNAQM
ncbi:MAG: hypothetical protein EON85_15915 [Brevundimonas sp.]|nr:MAG: hypothetical protein EON85_15915 [Brevundimonas sp.]